MHTNDIDEHGVVPMDADRGWLGPSTSNEITIEDWDAIVSLAIETLARDCDEMIAALKTKMNSPLSHLFDLSDLRIDHVTS